MLLKKFINICLIIFLPISELEASQTGSFLNYFSGFPDWLISFIIFIAIALFMFGIYTTLKFTQKNIIRSSLLGIALGITYYIFTSSLLGAFNTLWVITLVGYIGTFIFDIIFGIFHVLSFFTGGNKSGYFKGGGGRFGGGGASGKW